MFDIYLIISKNFSEPYSITMHVRPTFAEALKTMLSTDKDFVVVRKSGYELEDKFKAIGEFNRQFLTAEKEYNKTAKSHE